MFLEARGRAWLEGNELPVAIAVRAENGWRLVGSAGLQIDRYSQSADAGYWIDGEFEGCGLVNRTMEVLLDQALPLPRAGTGRPGTTLEPVCTFSPA